MRGGSNNLTWWVCAVRIKAVTDMVKRLVGQLSEAFCFYVFSVSTNINCQSQWPNDLRHDVSSTAQTPRSWARGTDICLQLYYVRVVLCVGRGLASGSSPVQGVLPAVYTPWPLVRERTIPTERPPLVDEI
jgi:hypothetical protein